MSLALYALTQLTAWPDLTEAVPSCGRGHALCSPHGEIVHFHSEQEADLHLTARFIHQFEARLKKSSAVRLVPSSQWVTIRLETISDIQLLLTLMSLALWAHSTWPVPGAAPWPRCNVRHHHGKELSPECLGDDRRTHSGQVAQ
ncbi:luciferase domain-containing protein [Streptomyces violascens]|uniref:luciferase domain-containing protein n=1 Tax=Streptomyces violascens TaxID=67381 RepID=UPI0036779EF3